MGVEVEAPDLVCGPCALGEVIQEDTAATVNEVPVVIGDGDGIDDDGDGDEYVVPIHNNAEPNSPATSSVLEGWALLRSQVNTHTRTHTHIHTYTHTQIHTYIQSTSMYIHKVIYIHSPIFFPYNVCTSMLSLSHTHCNTHTLQHTHTHCTHTHTLHTHTLHTHTHTHCAGERHRHQERAAAASSEEDEHIHVIAAVGVTHCDGGCARRHH